MIYALIALCVLGVCFFFGIFRKISKYYVNDFFALAVIFVVVLTNVISPIAIKGFDFYLGSAIMFASLTVTVFALQKRRALFLSVGAMALCSVLLGLFRFLLVEGIYVKPFIYVLSLASVGAIAGFCLGINPLLTFALPYVSFYLVDVVACFLGQRSLGGDAAFASGVFGGIAATVLYMVSGIIFKKEKGFSYAYEASEELVPKGKKHR